MTDKIQTNKGTENKSVESKTEKKIVETKAENKSEVKTVKEIKTETKAEVKDQPKKAEVKTEQKPKKTEAFANALSLHASKKHCMYISSFIKHKTIDQAIKDLNEVLLMKRPIPFKGEIPHRKGMMSGRYPVKVTQMFITILKGLKGNAISNGLNLDKTKITESISNWASRPSKKGGARFKRANVMIRVREETI